MATAPSFFKGSAEATGATNLVPVGQPTPHTHPHLLKPQEVTPGITATEYAIRRAALASKIPEGSVVIAAGFGLRYSTGAIFYPFHQNTDLFYLTGINEPDCAMILEKNKKYPNGHKYTLFVRPKDPTYELWDGPRAGFEGATSFFGADEAKAISKLPDTILHYLHDTLPTTAYIFSDLPLTSDASPSTLHPGHAVSAPSNTVRKLGDVLAELRVMKSSAEVEVMREAGRITGRAVQETMATMKAGVNESVIYSTVEHGIRKRGGDGLAYIPVIASGMNGLTVHYVMNKSIAKDGDLVLMDVGAEYGGYAADCTRTWPINGRFTPAQKDVYESVLRVQRECIKKCSEKSNTTLDELQNLAFELLRMECSRMFGRKIGTGEMNRLYPHHVGHWLGLDVHDCASVPRTRRLKEGMVVTVEPGLYIPPSNNYPSAYQGIGIRIEDDIYVGKEYPTILSVEAPKDVEDIEAVCNGVVQVRN
ncbi:peptidase M24, structural domain-containing protein [Chytridium lagenaria]|nr:peptidase M24, structural domain-containing protein [Chytridium lagenaria]